MNSCTVRRAAVKVHEATPGERPTWAHAYGQTDGRDVVMTPPARSGINGRKEWVLFNPKDGEVVLKSEDSRDRRRGEAVFRGVSTRTELLCQTARLFVPLSVRGFVCQYCPKKRSCTEGAMNLYYLPGAVAERYALPESDEPLWQRRAALPAVEGGAA